MICRATSSTGSGLAPAVAVTVTAGGTKVRRLPRGMSQWARRRAEPGSSSSSVVWFKRDLRMSDHPGLHRLLLSGPSSESTPKPVALFVMDPHVYASVVDTREAADALASAVAELGSNLQSVGVRLEVRCGTWEDVVPAFVRESSESSESISLVYERECEGAFARGTRAVADRLRGGSADVDVDADVRIKIEAEVWDSLLFPLDAYDESVEAFPEWERRRVRTGTAAKPLESLDVSLAADTSTNGQYFEGMLTGEAVWSSIEAIRNEATVHTDEASRVALFASSSEARAREILGAYLGGERLPSSASSEDADMLSAALASYDGDDQTIDGCYPAVFNRSINATGSLSRRQVHDQALRYLVEQGDTAPYDEAPLFRGPLSWLGWMLTSSGGALVRERKFKRVKAALNGAIQQDFHLGHSYRRDGMRHAYGATTRHWRWRGVLTDYVSVEGDDEGQRGRRPAIVLVHGFGAFGEHWRRNVKELADLGYDVYAPTFPGYGRSEKMSMQYGQDLWRDFLADFISTVVERPVVIAGNSIGGYISASVAADFPQLIKGLVLLNSAGQINEAFEPREYERALVENPRQPPPTVVVDAISTLLFQFLQGDVEKQLQRLYPARPEYADAWLGREIRRASQDPKALGGY